MRDLDGGVELQKIPRPLQVRIAGFGPGGGVDGGFPGGEVARASGDEGQGCFGILSVFSSSGREICLLRGGCGRDYFGRTYADPERGQI